jgi:hypothetical protein
MEVNTDQVLKGPMNKVTLGVLLCLSSLILLNSTHPAIGFIVFVVGIILMNGRKGPKN